MAALCVSFCNISQLNAREDRESYPAQWYGVFTHIGETNPMKKWHGFKTLIPKVIDIKEKNPYITGVTIKILWKHINPENGIYDFEGLDELLEFLYKNNMKVIFSMFTGNQSAPDWIYTAGAKKFITTKKIRGNPLYGPIPWDEVYMKLLKECLGALAREINHDDRIFGVGIYGHNFVGGEMIMAYANSPVDLDRWDALGKTDEVVLKNWKHWIDIYGARFTNKKLILTIGPPYGLKESRRRNGKLINAIADYAVKKYPTRIILQHMALHGRFDGLGVCWDKDDLDKCAGCQIKYRDRIPSGWETLGSFFSQPGRQGNAEMTVYNALKATPLYIQLWPNDALNEKGAELAKKIIDRYNEFKEIPLDKLREKLKREGYWLHNLRWEKRDKMTQRKLRRLQ